MDYIQTKGRKDILRLGIKDEQGNIVYDEQGNEVCLEFDMGDIDLPLIYNKCVHDIEQAKKNVRTQFFLIDKKPDHKRKNELLSINEQEKAKAFKKFFVEMETAMDLFLGKGGTRKFLNGRKPYIEMFDDLSEALEPHMSKLTDTTKNMVDRIKSKYNVEEIESDVLTDD